MNTPHQKSVLIDFIPDREQNRQLFNNNDLLPTGGPSPAIFLAGDRA
jgi:hypothetical protein